MALKHNHYLAWDNLCHQYTLLLNEQDMKFSFAFFSHSVKWKFVFGVNMLIWVDLQILSFKRGSGGHLV